jgi:hypothetical protein
MSCDLPHALHRNKFCGGPDLAAFIAQTVMWTLTQKDLATAHAGPLFALCSAFQCIRTIFGIVLMLVRSRDFFTIAQHPPSMPYPFNSERIVHAALSIQIVKVMCPKGLRGCVLQSLRFHDHAPPVRRDHNVTTRSVNDLAAQPVSAVASRLTKGCIACRAGVNAICLTPLVESDPVRPKNTVNHLMKYKTRLEQIIFYCHYSSQSVSNYTLQ